MTHHKKHLLMTPGPTPVPESSLLAQARGMIHHRGPEYGKIFTNVLNNLKYVFQTKNEVLIFTSSGTGAMESAVANLFSSGDKVIIVSGGKFGERWENISNSYQLKPVVIEVEWGKSANINEIKRVFDSNPDARGILCTFSETSTGAVNDVRSIAELSKNKDAVTVVDAVSGLGACELRTDDWNIDVVVSGSQKALMAPPGLGFASVSKKAWKFVEESNLPKFYFDYKKYRDYGKKTPPQNPYTPAISTMLALGKSLEMIKEEGLENVWKRHKILGKATREGLKALGLRLFSPDNESSAAVTAAYAPEKINSKDIVRIMREKHDITISGGQAKLKGVIFRIGHCGYFTRSDIISTIDAMESTLNELGHETSKGSGVSAAQKVFESNNLV